MAKDGDVKKKEIERFAGKLFIDVLKKYFGAIEVNTLETDSDPPDVLYSISDKRYKESLTWLEVTRVPPSSDTLKREADAEKAGLNEESVTERVHAEAKDALGYTETKKILGIPVLWEPDRKFAGKCKQAVLKKIRKTTYSDLCKKYGKGHLLLMIENYPLMDCDTARTIKPYLFQCLKQQSIFRSVWVAYRKPISLPDDNEDLCIVYVPINSSGYVYVLVSLWPDCNNPVSL